MYFDTKEFGKRLKEIRVIHGLTQEKLAEELNISWDHLSKIERGARSCSIDLLIAISGHFGVSTDYLLGRKAPGQETLVDLDGLTDKQKAAVIALVQSMKESH